MPVEYIVDTWNENYKVTINGDNKETYWHGKLFRTDRATNLEKDMFYEIVKLRQAIATISVTLDAEIDYTLRHPESYFPERKS